MFLYTLSQCLYKLDPKICELWEALVQLHDSQFPGQVRKTDMNKPLCVSFISGKNLGGKKKKEQGKIRIPLNPSMIWDSGLSESGFGWWCHLHINVCLSCYHCPTGTVSVRTSKSPLWLTSACKLSTVGFLICPFLPWLFFSFLDYYTNTDLSLLGSFVLIMLAHSAAHW